MVEVCTWAFGGQGGNLRLLESDSGSEEHKVNMSSLRYRVVH